MDYFTFLYFVFGVAYVILGIHTFLNDKKNTLNKIFLALCFFLSFWAVMFAFQNKAIDAKTACSFRIFSTFAWATVHCLILHYVIVLTGKKAFLNKIFYYIIFYCPAMISIYLYVIYKPPTPKNFIQTNLGWIYQRSNNNGFIWTHFFNAYYILYMIISIVLLFLWLKNSKILREKRQAKIIFGTFLITIILGGITDLVFPIMKIALIPSIGVIFVIIPIVGIGYSIKKYKLMDLNPESWALDVLKIMNEGLIILNHNGLIKDINNGALKLLGYEKNQLKDKNISMLFPKETDITKLIKCSSFETCMLKSNNNKLSVLISSEILKDKFGETIGIVGIFQDISGIKNVQEKLINSYDKLEVMVKERTIELSNTNKKLENEIKRRIKIEKKIKQLAYYDQLTGLPNKRLFNDRLNQCILDAVRTEKTFGILYLDLDSFKRINDTMGYAKGDELLKIISKKLKKILRKGDTVCRDGGDEFLILIKNLEAETSLKNVSEKIINIFKNPIIIDNRELYITTSIGGAIYPIDGQDTENNL